MILQAPPPQQPEIERAFTMDLKKKNRFQVYQKVQKMWNTNTSGKTREKTTQKKQTAYLR